MRTAPTLEALLPTTARLPGLAAPLPPLAPAVAAGAQRFDSARAKAHLDHLADPARGGRMSGSSGFADAAAYSVARLAEAGFAPLGDGGTYLQKFRMPFVDLAETTLLELRGPRGRSYAHRREFTEIIGGRAGSGSGEGRLVFVGAGISTASYSDFAGVNARGAIVLLFSGAPGVDALRNAAAAGAVGAIVIGILAGSDPAAARRAIVVGGHLDGVGADPDGTVVAAAKDNASGPAISLELARAQRRTGGLRRSVIVALFAGEEQGLLGSRAFLERLSGTPWAAGNLVAFLNLDVAGCCGTTLSASDEDGALAERVRIAAEREGTPFRAGFRGSSDQVSFTRQRVPAVMIAWADSGPLHTTRDTASSVDATHLGDAGRVALAVIRELAGEGR
ncbi:MAG: M28 family peptidase [Chloroflexi bacterium]|nr:M28 family peptidase [Chloroflexota bacterium]